MSGAAALPMGDPGRVTTHDTNNKHHKVKSSEKASQKSSTSPSVTLRAEESNQIGEGDSKIIYNFFSEDDSFQKLRDEVHWQRMFHATGEVPRLVCCQGEINSEDGSMPIYRHPSDQSLPLEPFSPFVQEVRARIENIVGHEMNHALIQLYRSGDDHITEHSDKTLDIVRGSVIVNASFGAQRTMRLRTKKTHKDHEAIGRCTQLVPMPHASLFILGPVSNMRWLHGIKWDRRAASERSEAERAFDGERISLTFRNIGTFLDAKSEHIWGQGAVAKRQNEARVVVNGDPETTIKIINAFGFENQASEFDWDAVYGEGFDVLHFHKTNST